MSRGGAAAAAAAAWRTVLSSASRNPPLRCRQGGGALEALLSPEKNELRKVRWLAASATTTKEPILHRSATTLPRRVGASSGLYPALSIHECKTHCRSFAAEPVTKEEKEKQKEKDEGDKDGGGGDPTSSTSSSATSSSKTSWRSAGWSLDSCATLPNAISAARALSAPFLFRAITGGDWELAGALLAFGAVSDWADGASARFLDARKRRKEEREGAGSSSSSSASSSSSSPLGTYLDPLADKVFIGAAVAAAAGWGGGDGGGGVFAGVLEGGGDDDAAAVAAGGGDKGEEEKGDGGSLQSGQSRWPLLPSWLAAAIIGRDVFLVAGSLLARLRQFEGARWPGGPEFFRLVDDEKKTNGNGGEKPPTALAAPRVRPLFVSKLNTALQFATVGAAVADSGGWLEEGIERARRRAAAAATGGGEEGGAAPAAAEAIAALASSLSGSDVVAALAAATAAMTAVSGWAYASAYLKAKRREK